MALIKGGQLDKKWRIALDSQPLGTYFPLFTTTVADVPIEHRQHDWPNPSVARAWRTRQVALDSQPLGSYQPLFTVVLADVPLSHIQHDWPNPSLAAVRRARQIAQQSQADVWQDYAPYYVAAPNAYTAVRNDVVLATGTGTINLTAAATVKTGGIICVKNMGVGVITVDAAGAETIDGAATFTLSNQFDAIMLITNGANWMIL